MKRAVILVIALSVVFGIVFWIYSLRASRKIEEDNQQVVLNFWGVREDESVFRPIIAAYQQLHPNVKINYTKQSILNYRTRLQTQLQARSGPDIFQIHSSFLPMFSGDLAPAPEEVIPLSEYNKIFYPVIKETLVLGGKVYAVPQEVDGLAMYVNVDILKAAGVDIPVSWQQFLDAARKVTVKNASGQIQTAGAAMGTTTNVDFWPEILGTLFLQQPEGSLISPANKSGSEILQFYTNFVTDPKNKTWDVTLPSSTQEFSEGKLAFYFAPSSQIKVLQTGNSDLHFITAPVPQLPERKSDYGSFWVVAVSARSPSQKEAWEFLRYLSLAGTLQTLDLGRPYPRVDMASLQAGDPVLGAFAVQAPYYKSWYLNSSTQDAGINDEIVKLYESAVNSVLQGGDSLGALQAIQQGIQQTLDKYKVGR